ncbi:nucleotidyltransferase [Virgibacillus dakarensis]|uniref:nucleotidyltransferase family protein n=1 Tax=Virgibacillus dakarensis TaxID=1917889 RepID=UPI000B42EFAA|nr:nucleotidyltransferase family protein [Virgibacillus dakarensis]MTW88342.1 nucleotidyltransferase [Virgibacillus dakarensis]
MLYDSVKGKRDLILKAASKHGIHNIRVFGSVARLEDGPESDLDLIVEIDKERSLFDLIRFTHEVEDLLSVRVDAVTECSIHSSIKKDILAEAFRL